MPDTNNKELVKLKQRETTQNDNVCCCCSNNNYKHDANDVYLKIQMLEKCLEPLITNIAQIKQDINQILIYNEHQRKRYTEEDLQHCYKLIEVKGYITKDLIEEDQELKDRYDKRVYVSDLFKKLLTKYSDLTDFRAGQGNKIWICKKGNEPAIEQIAKVTHKRKHRSKRVTKESDLNIIEQYLIENHAGQSLSVDRARALFSSNFNIKSKFKIRGLLKQLEEMGRIESTGIGAFVVLPNKEGS